MESYKPWLHIVWCAVLSVYVLVKEEVNSPCEEVSVWCFFVFYGMMRKRKLVVVSVVCKYQLQQRTEV
jgi:hypothetical protein